MYLMESSKRQRLSDDPSHLPPSPDLAPMSKSSRVSESSTGDRALLCTLPPTCNPPHHNPTPISNSRELEIHYAKYHAHVCEQRGCGCVFPDARLLELHQTECHDPLSAVRKERGEKIFACHLVSCPRLFLTPKTRRLHLIQVHAYPKEYFFAVTNKGVGGLLKRWGDGASMIRGTWKSRENGAQEEKKGLERDMEVDSDEEEEEGSDDDDEESGEETPKVRDDHHVHVRSPATSPKPPSPRQSGVRQSSTQVDELAHSMSSLSLIPASIRFGRGGKSGGFVHPELHNPQVLRGKFGPRGRGWAEISRNVHTHTRGHGTRGAASGRVSEEFAEQSGHPRGFPSRGGVIHVQRGGRGRGS
ncbi:hypothetical protein PAXRUDRAFT_823103 [Paxillus rubicundulus Ve08.2h10]|uniref:C2H2-type domain-containing protein n=1 Tax=Paxillus rubicundulus Ve08.2h10 TaxID=930991 RepID=A0A0D0ECC6_9AGAM|nr:hypothetical protein PAXRUDRAFT_823103 [Paxillus rubicundulus Ve08.2h10]